MKGAIFIMAEEKFNKVFGKVAGVTEKEATENAPARLYLLLKENNIFSFHEEEITVKLTETNDNGEYKRDALEKAFDTLKERVEGDVDFNLPKEIKVSTVETQIKKIEGQVVEVYVGTNTFKRDDGTEVETSYHSLYEPVSNFEYAQANAKVSELVDANPEKYKENAVFKLYPTAFQYEINTRRYDKASNSSEPVNMVEETATRLGLYKYLGGMLKQGTEKGEKEATKRLKNMQNLITADGKDINATTGEILSNVGTFSEEGKYAGDFSQLILSQLTSLLSRTSRSGRAYTGTVRILGNIEGESEEDVYRTSPLRELLYPNAKNRYRVIFNPQDTNFTEWKHILEPLYYLGVVTDSHVAELKEMTTYREIGEKIMQIILENRLVAKVTLAKNGNNSFFQLVGFELPQGDDVNRPLSKAVQNDNIDKSELASDEPLKEGVQEEKEQATQDASEDSVETQSEPETETETQSDNNSDNPFSTSNGKPIDISDDDLPF